MNNNFTSHSVNFNNMLKTQVNPRTLQFEVSLPIFSIVGNNHLGPELNMALNYSTLSDSNYGFGKGFSLNFTHFNIENNILELSNGEKYKIKEYSDEVLYQKIKNFKFYFTNGLDKKEGYTIDWKDGRKEYLERVPSSNIWAVTKIVSPIGKELYLKWVSGWSNSRSFSKLTEIRDTYHILCKIDYNDIHPYITFWPDSNEKYEIDFELDTDHLLRNITLMSHSERLSWSFDYDKFYIDLYPKPLLYEVTYPTGLSEMVSYEYYEGFMIPTDNKSYLPCVHVHYIYPGGDQPRISRAYYHSQNNFLGFGGGFYSNSSSNIDGMEEELTNYLYSTEEITGLNSSKVYTKRTYNNYHLIVSEEISSNDSYYLKEIEYYALSNTLTSNQPPQFQLPKKKKETWKNKTTGAIRTQITEMEFDENGNPIFQKEADGTVSEISWYKSSGETGCPKEPNGFVRFMKEKKVYSTSTLYKTPVYSSKYTYENLHNQESIVLKTQSEYADNNIFSRKEYYYSKSPSTEIGRITQIENTIYSLTGSSLSYKSSEFFSTKVENGKLYQTCLFRGHDGLESTSEKVTSFYRGNLVCEKDSKGFESEYTYDNLGRILTQTSFPKTVYEKKTQWKYSIENNFLVTTETDNEGNSFRKFFDGAGREVKHEVLDIDNNSTWREVSSNSYNSTGELISNSSIDWDTSQLNKKYVNTINYNYDNWRHIEKCTLSNGIVNISLDDPVDLTSKIFREGSDSSQTLKSGVLIKKYNLQGLVISKTLEDKNGKFVSSSEYSYDGLKRLIEEKDPLGRVTRYNYDILNRVSKVTLPDYTMVHYTYAPFSKSAYVSSIAVETRNTDNLYFKYAELGTQEFDSLGRIKSQTIGGRETQYKYEKDSIVPYLTITPAGEEIQYKSIPQLGDLISEIKTKDVLQTFNFNSKTSLPISTKDSNGFELEESWNISGTLKSESYIKPSKEKKIASYQWTLLGKPSLYTDFCGKNLKYIRNQFGEITSIEDDSIIAKLTYTPLKQLSSQEVQKRNFLEYIKTNFKYDDFGNEIERSITNNKGERIVTISQSWYKNGQLFSKRTSSDSILKQEIYEYDDRNRLIKYRVKGNSFPVDAYNNSMVEQSYSYDILSNIRSVMTKLKDGSQNTTIYYYDNKDDFSQLTSLTNSHGKYPSEIFLKYDANGRMILDEEGRSLSYDGIGRLTSISINSSIKVNYSYDSLNRILSQSINQGDTYDLYYRGQELVNQTIGKDKKEARIIKLNHHCLGVSFDKKLTLTATDEKANLIFSSEELGNEVDFHSYSPYGNTENLSDTLLGFNGERRDPFTGSYHLGNGYRSYSPVLMRFTCPDSLSPFGRGGINSYSYCLGDPINKTDPSGHISWQGWLGIGLGAIGIGVAILSGIGAIATAGGIIAALNSATASSLIIGGLGVASDITAIASGACENLSPNTSSILGWVSLATGVAGLAGSSTHLYLGIKSSKARYLEVIASATREETMIKDIQRIDKEFYIFDTTASNGERKLNVSAHGILQSDGTALLCSTSGFSTTPEELFEDIQTYRNIEEYDQIRLGMCYSGNGGENSFGQKLANLSGKPVKAYKGSVYTYLGKEIEEDIEFFKNNGISEILAESQALNLSEKHPFFAHKSNPFHVFQKDFWLFNYSPVSFDPIMAV